LFPHSADANRINCAVPTVSAYFDAMVDGTPTGVQNCEAMKQDQPTTPAEWLDEARLSIADARETKPFGLLTGQRITDSNLFHLAPLVCMKFRGLDYRDEELRTRVTEGALANYVANSDPVGIDHGLDQRPLFAFAMCYIAAHYVLDLIDEQEASLPTDAVASQVVYCFRLLQ
jgi:hypothetical protein